MTGIIVKIDQRSQKRDNKSLETTSMNKQHQLKKLSDLQKISLSMLVCLGSSTLFIPKALAQTVGTYAFNKYMGDVYVGVVKVSYGWMKGTTVNSSNCGGQDNACAGSYSSSWQDNGTKLSVNLSVPSCPNQNHIEGSVTINYKSGQGSITRVYALDAGNEGKLVNPSWDLRGYYGDPSKGNVNVKATSKCVYHGVDNQGGSKWSPWNW